MEQEDSVPPVVSDPTSKPLKILLLTVLSSLAWWVLNIALFGLAPVSVWSAILLSSCISVVIVIITRKVLRMRLRAHLLMSSGMALALSCYISIAAYLAFSRGEAIDASLAISLILSKMFGSYGFWLAVNQAKSD